MNAKPNKPQNVVDHMHFAVYSPSEMDQDEKLEDYRFDACLLADGRAGVWDVERDIWYDSDSYEIALIVAKSFRTARSNFLRRQSDKPIVPMKPGDMPTEPGWYVTRYSNSDRRMITQIGKDEDGMIYLPINLVFIARIYPERITSVE